jgi:hypothetical protein
MRRGFLVFGCGDGMGDTTGAGLAFVQRHGCGFRHRRAEGGVAAVQHSADRCGCAHLDGRSGSLDGLRDDQGRGKANGDIRGLTRPRTKPSKAGTLPCTVRAYVPLSGNAHLLNAIGATFIGTWFSPIGRLNVLGTLLGLRLPGSVANRLLLVGWIFNWRQVGSDVLMFFVLVVSIGGQCLTGLRRGRQARGAWGRFTAVGEQTPRFLIARNIDSLQVSVINDRRSQEFRVLTVEFTGFAATPDRSEARPATVVACFPLGLTAE